MVLLIISLLAMASPAQVMEQRIKVYVAGSVRHPGLYLLPLGARVADAIQAAGGTPQTAALGELELASLLQDGDSIRVPTRVRSLTQAGGSPQLSANRAVRKPFRYQSGNPRYHLAIDPPSRQANHTPRISLNHATAEELQQLPGIGPGLAKKILAYRLRVGRITSLDELRQVGGIGEKRLARLADHVDLR
ncbi:MAG: helix-hairpin-helix domain-containing protein [Cyanobacteria bacterium NC_groundwater_1444_Ag_S-0.65um_54_12]|nr:helix-hairpin-helix domain-containing protein [Cyanobacteria bacterium NC_groundwater_1444_Ag_S-0.65um_54_12]